MDNLEPATEEPTIFDPPTLEQVPPQAKKARTRGFLIAGLMLIVVIGAVRINDLNAHLQELETKIDTREKPNDYLPPANLESFVKEISKSIVDISCGDSGGTGFALNIAKPSAGFNTHIVTNYHVIQDCIDDPEGLGVTYNGERQSETESSLYSYDETNDLALLEIVAVLPTLKSTEYTAKPGWWTMAIGNPSTDSGILYNATTFGQIVGVEDNFWNYTSAIVNRGNSGGPLVNSSGELIGINSEHRVGIVQGIWNLAIDSDVLCKKILKC